MGLFKDAAVDNETMLAENNDDDPVTLKAFNAFQKEMNERFDALLRKLEEMLKKQEEEKKAREEEKKAQEEERKRREETQEEAWKDEKSLMGVIKKIISSYYDTMHRVKVD